MSPVGEDADDEELAVKRDSLALAAYYGILNSHEITVPVLLIEDERGDVVITSVEQIQDELDNCLALPVKTSAISRRSDVRYNQGL